MADEDEPTRMEEEEEEEQPVRQTKRKRRAAPSIDDEDEENPQLEEVKRAAIADSMVADSLRQAAEAEATAPAAAPSSSSSANKKKKTATGGEQQLVLRDPKGLKFRITLPNGELYNTFVGALDMVVEVDVQVVRHRDAEAPEKNWQGLEVATTTNDNVCGFYAKLKVKEQFFHSTADRISVPVRVSDLAKTTKIVKHHGPMLDILMQSKGNDPKLEIDPYAAPVLRSIAVFQVPTIIIQVEQPVYNDDDQAVECDVELKVEELKQTLAISKEAGWEEMEITLFAQKRAGSTETDQLLRFNFSGSSGLAYHRDICNGVSALDTDIPAWIAKAGTPVVSKAYATKWLIAIVKTIPPTGKMRLKVLSSGVLSLSVVYEDENASLEMRYILACKVPECD